MTRLARALLLLAALIRIASAAEPTPALPDAVRTTLQTTFPTAQIVRVQELRIGEKPDLWYNVRMTVDKRERDATFMSDGALREERDHPQAADLPQPVSEALAENLDGGAVKAIVCTTTYINERGRLNPPQVVYTFLLVKNRLTGSVVLDPDGNVLRPATWLTRAP